MADMDRIEEYLDRVAAQSDDLTSRIRDFVEEFNTETTTTEQSS